MESISSQLKFINCLLPYLDKISKKIWTWTGKFVSRMINCAEPKNVKDRTVIPRNPRTTKANWSVFIKKKI